MSIATVTIGRASLSKADLVISDDGPTYRFTPEGVGYVVQSVEVETAPDSADVDGSEVVTYRKKATSLPLEFHVLGATSADIAAAVADLEEAFYRLGYPVTRVVDGVSETYTGDPCALVPSSTGEESGMVAAFIRTYAVTIPFSNPNRSA